MSLLARRSMSSIGPPPFDPVSAVNWHAFYWASGPNFLAEGYGDTDLIPTWPDETGNGNDLVQATEANQPALVAAHEGFNNRPAVDFANDVLSVALHATVTQPGELWMVSKANITGNERPLCGSWIVQQFGGQWAIDAGTLVIGDPDDANLHVMRATFDTTDVLTFDETTEIASGNAGSGSMSTLRLGNDGSVDFFNGAHAAFGVKDSLMTAGEIAAMLGWAQAFYGTPS